MFRRGGKAAAPDFLAVLKPAELSSALLPHPEGGPGPAQPSDERPFRRPGRPEEMTFVGCSSQHKGRAVLGLSARLMSAERCQGLPAAPSAFCASLATAFSAPALVMRGQGGAPRLE